jgi:hypothetical protein
MGNKFLFVYGFQTYEVPERMRESLELYVKKGVRPGSFFTAIIQNNLKEAVAMADDENMQNIPAYVNYFYNHAPIPCWGSEKKMEAWIKGIQI